MSNQTNSMQKEQKDYDASIAVIFEHIGYMRKDMTEIKNNLTVVLQHYIQRQEMESKLKDIHTEVDGRIKGIHERLSEKVDKVDYEKLLKKLDGENQRSQINWTAIAQSVITAVITAAVMGGLIISLVPQI